MANDCLSDRPDWVIYGLHSGNFVVRYVGYTTQPHERLLQHRSAARCGKQRAVCNWIRAVHAKGGEIEMIILEEGCGEAWDSAETAWIARLDGRLLNQTSGGRTGPAVSPEARSAAGLKLRGRIFTPEHRRRISEAKQGTKRPDNLARNREIAARLKGRKLNLSDEERERRRERGRIAGAATKARRAAETPEQREIRATRTSESMRKVWAGRSAEKLDGIVEAVKRGRSND